MKVALNIRVNLKVSGVCLFDCWGACTFSFKFFGFLFFFRNFAPNFKDL